MGKFDGILLCSDFDQTLAIREHVSEENIAAIRYFEENGGFFTIVSGRHPHFLRKHLEGFCVNAPLAGYHGALIVDADSERVFYRGGFDNTELLAAFRPFWEQDARIRELVSHDDSPSSLRCRRDGTGCTFEDLFSHFTPPLYNVLCSVPTEEDGITLRDDLKKALCHLPVLVERSWVRGVEIIREDDRKGEALRRIADMVGATRTVAVGDFENDVSMIKAADIGYAVGNALPEVKAIADRVCVSCEDHAIAAIVAEIEKWGL